MKFKNIARLMRSSRLKVDISQGKLAKKLGYKNGQLVSNIERGICSVPLKKAALVCELLNIDPIALKMAVMDDVSLELDKSLRIAK